MARAHQNPPCGQGSKERRGAMRMPVAWRAVLTRLNGEQLPGCTHDISETGLSVMLEKHLVIGEPIKIELISKSCMGINYFHVDAVVVSTAEQAEGLGKAIGLRMMQPDARLIDILYRTAFAADQLDETGYMVG